MTTMTDNYERFAITDDHKIDDNDFESNFGDNYSLLLTQQKDAFSLYKGLTESVIVYFAKSYPENEVMVKAVDFLAKNFLQTAQDIKEKADVTIEQKCLECEVMTLIELFILRLRPCPLSQTNITKKFRFLYWNRGNATREFLDKQVSKEFIMDIPLYITQIYEEMEFDLPLELKKFESLENQLLNGSGEAFIDLNKDAKETCKMLLKELKPESPPKTANGKSKELRRSPRKSRPPLSYSPMKTLSRPKIKNETPTKNGRKRKIFVAETPEDRLQKKPKCDGDDGDIEVVTQTPYEKIKKTKGKEGRKLSALLQKSEENPLKRRASRRLSMFGPGIKPANSMPHVLSSGSISSTQSTNITFNGSTQSQSSTSLKLSNSLAVLSRVSSTKSLSAASTSSAPVLRSPAKQLPSLSTSTLPTGPMVPDHLNAALTLSPDIIQKYKRRMEIVRAASKKADSSEVFYGKQAGRPNLFNEDVDTQVEKPATRSTTTASASQKNRSGRKVEQDTNAVYVAHTLLNVHNEAPLAPFKVPKDSPFKVRKLVKHATRADWKKLQKFIAKTQIERSDSTSTSS